MRKLILFFIVFFPATNVFSQSFRYYHGGIFNPMILQHWANKSFYNPAALGEKEDQVLTTAVSVNSAANGYSSTASYEFPLLRNKHAFAIQLNQYRNGVYRNMQMRHYFKNDSFEYTTAMEGINIFETSIQYSRAFYLGAEANLNVGVQAVFRRFNFLPDWDDRTFPTIINYRYPEYRPDLNFGAQFRYRDFYIGGAVKNLFEPSFSVTYLDPNFNNGEPESYNVYHFGIKNHTTAYIMAGNLFRLNDNIKLQSSLLIATDEGNMYANNFDLNNTFIFNSKYKIGFSLKDPSVYDMEMYEKYGGYQLLGRRSFGFNNFALNTGLTVENVDIGFAFAAQDFTNKGWILNAGEGYLKVRI